MGHSYIGDHSSILSDVHAVLHHGTPRRVASASRRSSTGTAPTGSSCPGGADGRKEPCRHPPLG
ncbi:hypothetical protein ACFQ60_08380 [Streptomyces zhihengii]